MTLQACSLSEDATHTLLRKACELEFSGDVKKAEETFRQIPVLADKKFTPLQLAVLTNMARFYLRTKNYPKAIITCDKALKICDEVYSANDQLKASILFTQASAYEGLTDYNKAKSIYNSLVIFAQQNNATKEMRSLLPLLKLGDLEFKQNNFEQAFRLYHRASLSTLLPYPIYRIINYRMAFCSLALGHYSLAETEFKNSLPTNHREPGPAELFDVYAELLKKNQKYGSAGMVLNQKADWQMKRQAYLNWLRPRTVESFPFDLMDKCTEKDFLDYLDNARKNCNADNLP